MKSCSRLLTLVTFLAATFLGASPSVWAKDQHGKLGLGYNAQFVNASTSGGVPAISLKYGVTRDIAAEGLVGVATSSPSNSVVGIKFFKNLFYETNLNFYFMLGGGILSANGRSGAQFLGGFGAEFFIPGIESLGFSVESGGSFENITTGSFILRTMGISFLEAGIHFYF